MYFEVAIEYKMRVRLIRSLCDHIWKGQIQVLRGKKRNTTSSGVSGQNEKVLSERSGIKQTNKQKTSVLNVTLFFHSTFILLIYVYFRRIISALTHNIQPVPILIIDYYQPFLPTQI